MNIYQLLGIDESANLNEIRRAYAALIKQYRPDTHPTQFGDIRAAYEIAVSNFHAHALEQAELQSAPAPELPTASASSVQTLESSEAYETPQPAEILETEAQRQFKAYLLQLIEFSTTSNEFAAAQLTTHFLNGLSEYTLDETSAIEIELLNWIFSTPNPLLLSFLKLDDHFRWSTEHAFSQGEFSHSAVEWLSKVWTIADFYANAIEQNSTSLATHPDYPWSLPLTKNSTNIRKQWEQLCELTGYTQLKPYFKPAPTSKFPVFGTDILLATAGTALGWLFTRNNSGAIPYLIAPLAFFITLAFSVYAVPLLSILSKSTNLGKLKPLMIGISIYALLATLHTIQNEAPTRPIPASITESTFPSAKRAQPTPSFDQEADLPEALKYLGVQQTIGEQAKIPLPVIPQCNGIQKTTSPVYPEESRLRNEQGTVVLKLVIDSKGSVSDASVKHSSGIDRLDKAALEAVRTWCLKPPQQQGKPATAEVEAPFDFKLN